MMLQYGNECHCGYHGNAYELQEKPEPLRCNKCWKMRDNANRRSPPNGLLYHIEIFFYSRWLQDRFSDVYIIIFQWTPALPVAGQCRDTSRKNSCMTFQTSKCFYPPQRMLEISPRELSFVNFLEINSLPLTTFQRPFSPPPRRLFHCLFL